MKLRSGLPEQLRQKGIESISVRHHEVLQRRETCRCGRVPRTAALIQATRAFRPESVGISSICLPCIKNRLSQSILLLHKTSCADWRQLLSSVAAKATTASRCPDAVARACPPGVIAAVTACTTAHAADHVSGQAAVGRWLPTRVSATPYAEPLSGLEHRLPQPCC